MTSGERSTLAGLLRKHTAVCIPILQRDYAQGRPAEFELRTAFLLALREALQKPEDDPTLPLDLDFVYGSLDADGSFNPLDGQQRLTTLFLLHWYLAAKEGVAVEFARKPPPARGSRFTYAVRSSSREFFDALIDWRPKLWRTLSEEICDQSWFFLRWKLDPTIQSVVNMLDSIHATFGEANCSYARLVSVDSPAVTFQLLDLRDFGLSDDLYIKMNARGKPLTGFEAFKAQLEEHIDAVLPNDHFDLDGRMVSTREYFSHRIDTTWADVLWHFRDPKTALADDGFMNLVRAVVAVTRRAERANVGSLIDALRDRSESFPFARYQREGCLDAEFLRTLIALLDAWAGGEDGIRVQLPKGNIFDERALVARLLSDATSLTYEQLLQFGAYSSFIQHHPAADAQSFGEWMRVLRNLAANTPYDRADDLIRSLQSMRELLASATDILKFLTSSVSKAMRGFYGQQQVEERMKAWLLLRGGTWRTAIESAERHGYFAGQIEFLLDFAEVRSEWNEDSGFVWTSEEEDIRLQRFLEYSKKAFSVFDKDGLAPLPNFLWERALLAHGDYLLAIGSNSSLLVNASRDESWKRLLRGGPAYLATKRALVRDVFDDIDLALGVKASLIQLVDNCDPDVAWRRLFVHHPEAIAYCSRRYVRKAGGNHVYLMNKVRMSGAHAELYSYVLYRRLLSNAAAFSQADQLIYSFPDTDTLQPFGLISIAGHNGRFSAQFYWNNDDVKIVLLPVRLGDDEQPLPPSFVEELVALGFFVEKGHLAICATLDAAETLLVDLARRAKQWDLAPG